MWLAMWKSLIRYKEDKSVWSSNYKDFIYRDDKKNMIKNKTFDNKDYKKYDVAWPTHPERTPGKKKVRVEMKKRCCSSLSIFKLGIFSVKTMLVQMF